jgi:hypothetical protein
VYNETQEHLSYGEKENDHSKKEYHHQPLAEKHNHAPQTGQPVNDIAQTGTSA